MMNIAALMLKQAVAQSLSRGQSQLGKAMLQFRPGGPYYDESDVGWVIRNGQRHVCLANEVQVGDLLPNCDVRDPSDMSIRQLIQVREVRRVPRHG